LWQNALFFAAMVAILVFANWGRPEGTAGFWHTVFAAKWIIAALAAAALGVMLVFWFGLSYLRLLSAAAPVVLLAALFPGHPILPFAAGVVGLSLITGTDSGETREWFGASWGFAKQILPLLFFGVLIAGVLLGRPGHEGAIPAAWIGRHVGGNSLGANLFASVAGALMYFATLTEVPILQGLMGSGMGKGPALALLLAGPALSLPNMLVIRSVMGTGRTAAFVILVVLMATASGMIYGTIF
jgi:uncharacterized membrane protein YraQ (UPF0718 family)